MTPRLTGIPFYPTPIVRFAATPDPTTGEPRRVEYPRNSEIQQGNIESGEGVEALYGEGVHIAIPETATVNPAYLDEHTVKVPCRECNGYIPISKAIAVNTERQGTRGVYEEFRHAKPGEPGYDEQTGRLCVPGTNVLPRKRRR